VIDNLIVLLYSLLLALCGLRNCVISSPRLLA